MISARQKIQRMIIKKRNGLIWMQKNGMA